MDSQQNRNERVFVRSITLILFLCSTLLILFNNYYSPIITEPEANNCFNINTQVSIPKTKRKSIVKHEKKNLFRQKRANNWQPFCSSRLLSADSPRIANQSERAILYNHLSIYTKMEW